MEKSFWKSNWMRIRLKGKRVHLHNSVVSASLDKIDNDKTSRQKTKFSESKTTKYLKTSLTKIKT